MRISSIIGLPDTRLIEREVVLRRLETEEAFGPQPTSNLIRDVRICGSCSHTLADCFPCRFPFCGRCECHCRLKCCEPFEWCRCCCCGLFCSCYRFEWCCPFGCCGPFDCYCPLECCAPFGGCCCLPFGGCCEPPGCCEGPCGPSAEAILLAQAKAGLLRRMQSFDWQIVHGHWVSAGHGLGEFLDVVI